MPTRQRRKRPPSAPRLPPAAWPALALASLTAVACVGGPAAGDYTGTLERSSGCAAVGQPDGRTFVVQVSAADPDGFFWLWFLHPDDSRACSLTAQTEDLDTSSVFSPEACDEAIQPPSFVLIDGLLTGSDARLDLMLTWAPPGGKTGGAGTCSVRDHWTLRH